MSQLRFSAYQYKADGPWTLLGSVPLRLAYVDREGSELIDDDIRCLAAGDEIPGLRQRMWDTFQGLLDSVKQEGFTRQRGQLGFEGVGVGASRLYEKA